MAVGAVGPTKLKDSVQKVSKLNLEKWRLNVRSKDRSLPSDLLIGNRPMKVQRLIRSTNSSDTEYFRRFSKSFGSSSQVEEMDQSTDVNDEIIIEGFVISAGRLIIRTINDLSSALITVNEKLYREKDRNQSFAYEIDRLRAMMRVSSGDGNEYRERIKELGDYIRRIDQETSQLRNFNENPNDLGLSITVLKSLMTELRTKLENDLEALFSGGNRWCSMYIRNVRRLESAVESLLLQLEKTGKPKSTLTFNMNDTEILEYQAGVKTIQQLVKRVAFDLGSLTAMPIKSGSPIGSQTCAKYSKRINFLKELVMSSMTIVGSLIGKSNDKFQQPTGSFKKIGTLEVIAKKLVSGIEQLEKSVAAGDGSYFFEKIRQLESSARRSRKKLMKSEEEKNSLALELTGAKISYDEKSEALEKIQKKYERIAKRVKNRGESLNEEEKMADVLRDLEQSKLEANVLQDEVNQLKPEVARLISEIENIRCVVTEKDEQIEKMAKDNKSKLLAEEKEVRFLKNEVSNLKRNKEIIEMETKTIKEKLDSKMLHMSSLENDMNQIKIEKSKIEQECSCLKKQNEALVGCLNFEKSTHSKTLEDLKKLIADFQSLTDDLSTLEVEKKNLQKAIESSQREKTQLRSNLKDLERGLAETKRKNQETNQELIKANQACKDHAARLESSTKEIEKLNEQLDKARSDKLDIAGVLNEANYNHELTKAALAAKIKEAKFIEDKLSSNLQAIEDSEKMTKLEIVTLRETIRIAKLEKTELEKHFRGVENDCHELRNKLSISEVQNDELTRDALALRKRVKELDGELETLRRAEEKNVLDRVELRKELRDELRNELRDELRNELRNELRDELRTDLRTELRTEHQTATAALQEKLIAFEAEITQIKDENTALKRGSEEITRENEKFRSVGKKGEINRLTDENEALKLQLSKLTIFIAEADREVAKKEMERMCSELVQFRAENTTLKKLRNRKRPLEESPRDMKKLEAELIGLKLERESLRSSLESKRKEIAIQNEKLKEIETERDLLKGSIEGLKERYKLSRRETEDANSRIQSLDFETIELKKNLEFAKIENSEQRKHIKNMERDFELANEENLKIEKKWVNADRELVALKDELAKLRNEKIRLDSQVDYKDTENASLRRELEETRCARILAVEETNEIRSELEKLTSQKITLEGKLIDAQKEIEKYVVATEKLDDLEKKLKNALKSYVITKKLLRSANEEIALLRNLANPRFQTCNYRKKIEAT